MGPIEGLWRNSLFNNTVSHELVNERLVNPFKRKVSFQAVNINDAKVYSFDETLSPSLQAESVVASTTIPVAFKPTDTIGDL